MTWIFVVIISIKQLHFVPFPSRHRFLDVLEKAWGGNLRWQLSVLDFRETGAHQWWFSTCCRCSVKNGISLPGTTWSLITGLSWEKLGPCPTGSSNWRSWGPGETTQDPRSWRGRLKPCRTTLGKQTGTGICIMKTLVFRTFFLLKNSEINSKNYVIHYKMW